MDAKLSGSRTFHRVGELIILLLSAFPISGLFCLKEKWKIAHKIWADYCGNVYVAKFTIRNEGYAERVRGSFERQAFMKTIGAKLTEIGPGIAEIAVPFSEGVTQQHGFFHGGLIGTIGDNAGGYAAFTLMAESDSVLTVEYKLNIMAPANGEILISRAHVLKSGRTLSVCQSDILVVRDGVEHHCATMLGTFMTMANMSDEPDNG